MKKFYSKFRIALITFTFGLASFWLFDGITNGLIDQPVNLPTTNSGEILVVFPKYRNEMPRGGGGGSGGSDGCGRWELDKLAEESEKKQKKRKR